MIFVKVGKNLKRFTIELAGRESRGIAVLYFRPLH